MPFEDCICFRLGKATKKVTKAYRDEISAYGLTHSQFFLMVAVLETEGLLPSELADKTSQDRPTITGVLDRLEKDQWIERKADPNDRRSLRIYAGTRGKAFKKEILSLFEETNQKLLARFSEAEWQQMQDFLVRLEE
ncbi:MarR family transcriptional regulator [Desulfosarcina sp. OttesenSCG-928-A07]|nr:MarR family transcriptional regulator [Desulfosarcina sp. OttesenSCG-928-G17]MDL2330106.1 MarR family transcriptional regulator [Desulfosarcina sp. OttesenSCG-928-A07]